jgi:hypothetical protein
MSSNTLEIVRFGFQVFSGFFGLLQVFLRFSLFGFVQFRSPRSSAGWSV